ncbi:N-acetylmuramoyl-L-alanine amidase [bacterium]|nr:N-acetylmuramoyl-L-alanine amidase [bacterium]
MNYEGIVSVMTILVLAAVSVERILEVLKKVMETSGFFGLKIWQRRFDITPKLENSGENLAPPPETAEGNPGTLVVITAGKLPDPEKIVLRFFLQLIGAIVGTVLCFTGKMGVFTLLKTPLGTSLAATYADYVLTGILIGAGTEPIHTLIRFLEAKRELSRNERSVPVQEVELAPEVESTAKRMIDIDYLGGVNPDKLISRKRSQNPDTILLHHTGMQQTLPFENLVQIFEARGFETGFHAVIDHEGHVHAFCRWDGVGQHTAAVDANSLGLAFSGNFETDAAKAGSNADGRLGSTIPTDAQLATGAKVVALWSLLYSIEIPGKLKTHHEIYDAGVTTCPGSNFPLQRFTALISECLTEWAASPKAKGELADFGLKKYLFV